MLRFAILGAGSIARTMADTVNGMKGEIEPYAISYEEMLADPKVDLVYIAVPHSHHHRWTLAALNAGKNVLCEKSFAANETQAREMIELAERKHLLLTEAIWTRYQPSRSKAESSETSARSLPTSGIRSPMWSVCSVRSSPAAACWICRFMS